MGKQIKCRRLRPSSALAYVNIYEHFAARGGGGGTRRRRHSPAVFDGFRYISLTARVVVETPLQRICCCNLPDACLQFMNEYFMSQ